MTLHSECHSSASICYRAALCLNWSKTATGRHAAHLDIVSITPICSFFSQAHRIIATNYIPSNEDILRTPVSVTGITENYFKMGQLTLRLCHISGLRGERKKWIHQFECVESIIFCAPLADYDQFSKDGRVCACLLFALTWMTANCRIC